MLHHPTPPHLELHFYLAEGNAGVNMRRMLEVLEKRGVPAEGKLQARDEYDLHSRDFDLADSNSWPAIEQLVAGIRDGFVEQVVRGATKAIGRKRELVQLRLRNHCGKPDANGMLSIITSGELFSPSGKRSEARKVGKRVTKRFLILCQDLAPDYACITSEHSMETPAELRKNPLSLGFRDFYLRRDGWEEGFLDNLQEEFTGAGGSCQWDRQGAYFSASADWNSGRAEIGDIDLLSRIERMVGREIARRFAGK